MARLPRHSPLAAARRLVTRANAERDAGRHQAAAALYDEALRLAPDMPRFHIQAGHLYKEAGDHGAAERHYGEALRRLPDDPDLAIQLGHFYKVGGRLDEAETHYARAVALRPGWSEAEIELAGVRASPVAPAGAGDVPVPELLPVEPTATGGALREGFEIRRLGATRARTRGGYRRVVRGVEAIRGFVVSARPLGEVTLRIDDDVVAREPLHPWPLPGGRQIKHVFNLWHDFSDHPAGPVQIELRVVDSHGVSRSHRAIVDILPPLTEQDAPDSDAIVGPLPADGRSVEARVNARPSMTRPAARGLLPSVPSAILVQRVDQLGDLVSTVPAIARLRRHFPDTRLVALVTPANADLARTLAMLDDVVVIDFREERADGRKAMDAAAQADLRRALAGYRFDAAIDFGETATSRPLLLLSGAPFLAGFKGRDFPWLSLGVELDGHDPGNHHEHVGHARKLEALVEAFVAYAGGQATIVARDDLDPACPARHGIPPGTRYALLHTGARLAYSRWPGFARLAALLIERTDLAVVMMGEEPATGLPVSDRVIEVTGRMPFDDFDALLSFAAVFVGNDSGPKHLAALRGVPVVSLHMARLNWNEWGQVQTGLILSRRVPCAGCGIGGDAEDCGKDFACIRLITPEEAFDAVSRLL